MIKVALQTLIFLLIHAFLFRYFLNLLPLFPVPMLLFLEVYSQRLDFTELFIFVLRAGVGPWCVLRA